MPQSTCTVFYVKQSSSSVWQLPSGSDPFRYPALLAWRSDPEPTNSGVPERAASALSEALCKLGAVGYLTENPKVGGTAIHPGLLKRLGGKNQLLLAKTEQAGTVAALLDDSEISWSQQGQILFLLDRAAPLPQVRYDAIEARDVAAFHRAGCAGVLLPGVDGDVAGFYPFDEPLARALPAALRQACAAHDCLFAEVTEDALRFALATRPSE